MELLFQQSLDALSKVINGETARLAAGDATEADWIARDLTGLSAILMHLHDT